MGKHWQPADLLPDSSSPDFFDQVGEGIKGFGIAQIPSSAAFGIKHLDAGRHAHAWECGAGVPARKGVCQGLACAALGAVVRRAHGDAGAGGGSGRARCRVQRVREHGGFMLAAMHNAPT